MKKARFATKALVLLLVTILLAGSAALSAFAADREYAYGNQYGQIIPTDSKLSAPKKSYSFSGDKASLYFMRISEGEKNAHFAIEIYSDKEYKDAIRSLSYEFDSEAGNKPLKITWDFKSTPSGTYYGKCYTFVERSDGNVIDSDSVRTFTIKIDRVGNKTVKLKSVTNLSNGVKITWTPLVTGTKYHILRKGPSDEKWVKIASLGKGKSSYIDETAKSGKKYSYTVKCYDGSYVSLYNKTGLSITYLSTPKLAKIGTSGSQGYAKISWSKVSGAKGYYVYRKGGSLSNSSWSKIATISSGKTVSYVDKTAKSSDWKYTYTIKAFSGSVSSASDNKGVDFNYILPPTLKSASATGDAVKITWKDSSTISTHYYIYRKAAGKTEWTKIGKTEKTSFTDSSVKSGKKYTYTVRAAASTNNGGFNANGISITYLSAPALKSVSFDSSQRAKITWEKVSGASGYRVYRKITGEKSWTKIADITKGTTVSYLDTVKKSSGKTYTYTVKAVKGNYVSAYNSKGISSMFLSKPTFTLINKSTDTPVGIYVSWKSVKGAQSYNVFRRAAGETAWKKIGKNIEKLTFHDTTVKKGVTYEYSVKALNGSAASKYNVEKIIALEKPVISDVTVTKSGTSLVWNKVKGADTYYILRKAPSDAEWTTINTYSLNSFTDESKEAQKTRFLYTVIAESKGTKSDFDEIGVKNYAEVSSFSAKFTDATEEAAASITVKWAFDNDYDYIKLYKTTADEKKVLIQTVKKEESIKKFTDLDITAGNEYTYSIRVIKEGKITTEKTVSAKFPHPPIEAVSFSLKAKFSDNGSYINVTFNEAEFADKYEILRRKSKNDEWEKIGTVKASKLTDGVGKFKDEAIEEDVKYYYTVKAVASDRDSLFNEKGKTAIVYRPVPAVAGIIASAVTSTDGEKKKTGAKISWDTIETIKVQNYSILRKTEGGEWKEIGCVDASESSFKDYTIEQGVKYVYTVVGIAENRTSKTNEAGAEFCWAAEEKEDVKEEK